MSIASPTGEVRGGHVVQGNCVRTTVEVMLFAMTEWTLSRTLAPGTGCLELAVRRSAGSGEP
ncbi:hypothetical protein BH11PSE8_BH11PSE8_28020 [soil metagenome]